MREGISLPPPNRLWRPLLQEEMEKIEETAYNILNEVGIWIETEELLKQAEKIGCDVDYKTKMTKFPENTAKGWHKKVPKKFILPAREPENDLQFEGPGTKTYSMTGAQPPRICLWDEERKQYTYRDATFNDVFYAAKIADALETVDILLSPVAATDKAKEYGTNGIFEQFACITGCTKHDTTSLNTRTIEEWDYIARIAAEAVGGLDELRKRPIISVCTVWPGLRMPRGACFNIMEAAKYGLADNLCGPAVSAPAYAPITLAGSIAMNIAGDLAGLALAQSLSPGRPFIAEAAVAPLSPKYGVILMDNPSDLIGNAGVCQIMHELFGIPVINPPLGTTAITPDVQAAWELFAGIAFSILAGFDVSFTIGFNTNDYMSPEMMVFCDGHTKYMKHLMREINYLEPTSENLAYEAVKECGPLGNMWTHPHSTKHLDLLFESEYADYRPISMQQKDPKLAMDRVRAKVKELEKHEPKKLPPDVHNRMEGLLNEFVAKVKK